MTPATPIDAAAVENTIAHIEADTAVTEAQAAASVAVAEASTAEAEARSALAEVIADNPQAAIESNEDDDLQWAEQKFSELRNELAEVKTLLLNLEAKLSEQNNRFLEMLTRIAEVALTNPQPNPAAPSTPENLPTPTPVIPESVPEPAESTPAEQSETKRKRRKI